MRVNLNINLTVNNVSELKKALKALEKTRVLVGVPADKSERREEDGPTNAEIAYVHDNGSAIAGIPARPFMEPGILDAKIEITKRMGDAARAALDGREEAVMKNLVATGIVATSSIKNVIDEGDFIPLSERTIAARKRKGITNEVPLHVTGQLRNSIDSEVERA